MCKWYALDLGCDTSNSRSLPNYEIKKAETYECIKLRSYNTYALWKQMECILITITYDAWAFSGVKVNTWAYPRFIDWVLLPCPFTFPFSLPFLTCIRNCIVGCTTRGTKVKLVGLTFDLIISLHLPYLTKFKASFS